MLTHIGNRHTYTCDRCGRTEGVLDDDRQDRQPCPTDPLAQRKHDAPVGWVIVAMDLMDRGPVILGPQANKALWCKECGHAAAAFARGRNLSDVY